MLRLRIALCVLATLSGCTSLRLLEIEETSLAPGELPVLASDEGILVMHVHTDVPIGKLQLSPWTALSDLPRGEHLRLLAVRASGYRWSGVVIPAGEGDVTMTEYALFEKFFGDFLNREPMSVEHQAGCHLDLAYVSVLRLQDDQVAP